MMRAKDGINGGAFAHVIRRLLHILMIVIPLFYYYFLITRFDLQSLHHSIVVIWFLIIVFEAIRLRYKFVFFAQRQNEANRISAVSWTLFSIGMVLIFTPAAGYAMAIIFSCALVDPLLGEMRARTKDTFLILVCGLVLVFIIWFLAVEIYSIPLWLAFVMPPVTVAAEWFKTRWIDDNALMLLVPLLIVSFL